MALLLLSLTAILAAGCRSGGENDLVARELRMQEDQLYAMEDYLTQYQQLLRKCRAENAALKCELAERGEELPGPAARNRRPSSVREPSRLTTPPADAPTQPETDETPATTPENIQLPDVPPLEETTDSDAGLPKANSFHDDPQILAATVVVDEPSDEPEVSTPTENISELPNGSIEQDSSPISDELQSSAAVPMQILLAGEVISGEAESGPRLVVEVAPLASNGEPASYFGGLSLMVLAPKDGGQPQSLARWDFSAEDAQAAIAEADDGRAMRFYLELPVGAAADGPVQLWARLMLPAGDKLLAHANIDFHQPGEFSSAIDSQAPHDFADQQEQPLATEQIELDVPIETSVQVVERERDDARRPIHVDVTDGSWNVALPGNPQGFAQRESEPTGSWRTASEPLPTVAVRSPGKEFSRQPSRVHAATHSVERAAYAEVPNSLPPRRFEMPTWSPDRAGRPESTGKRETHTAVLPSWSPDR